MMKKLSSIATSWELVSNQASRDCVQPAVSVVITLYNYSAYIQGCLDSVRASKTDGLPGGFEVVVVDDGSTDSSVKLVEAYMAVHALPICLVKKLVNSGLADARNIGLRMARAPLVFILDADNEIRPDCLLAHYHALVSSDCAMAYGYINRFDPITRQSLGIMSNCEWDARELVFRQYIDAMAMVKKEIVLRLGGYSPEYGAILPQGREDYDLWLKLAQAGYSGKMIPRILSDYRVHGQSMLQQLTPFRHESSMYLLRKFHALAKQHDDLPGFFGYSRRELLIACGQARGLQSQAKSKSSRLVRQLLGAKMCKSICKRLAAVYCWLHP